MKEAEELENPKSSDNEKPSGIEEIQLDKKLSASDMLDVLEGNEGKAITVTTSKRWLTMQELRNEARRRDMPLVRSYRGLKITAWLEPSRAAAYYERRAGLRNIGGVKTAPDRDIEKMALNAAETLSTFVTIDFILTVIGIEDRSQRVRNLVGAALTGAGYIRKQRRVTGSSDPVWGYQRVRGNARATDDGYKEDSE